MTYFFPFSPNCNCKTAQKQNDQTDDKMVDTISCTGQECEEISWKENKKITWHLGKTTHQKHLINF